MRFGLRAVFAFVLIAALLMFGWKKYLSPEDNYIEIGVFLKDWDLGKSNGFELTDMVNRPFPDKGQNQVGDFYRGVDRVSISPGYSAIWFKTRFRDWDRDHAVQRLRDVVGAFLDADPNLQIDYFEMREFTLEFTDDTRSKQNLRETTSESFPLLMSTDQ
ncbi:MAG: hypothetical protein ACR2NF_02550 [Pirellulales bacterium]